MIGSGLLFFKSMCNTKLKTGPMDTMEVITCQDCGLMELLFWNVHLALGLLDSALLE